MSLRQARCQGIHKTGRLHLGSGRHAARTWHCSQLTLLLVECKGCPAVRLTFRVHLFPIQAGSPALRADFPKQEPWNLLHQLHQGSKVQAVLGCSSCWRGRSESPLTTSAQHSRYCMHFMWSLNYIKSGKGETVGYEIKRTRTQAGDLLMGTARTGSWDPG